MSEYKNENLTKFWVFYGEKSVENIRIFFGKNFLCFNFSMAVQK